MLTLPVPPMLKLFSAGVAFGGFWTPPEDHIPSSLGPVFRFGLVVPDSPLELDASVLMSSGELREVPFRESTSLTHAALLTDVVDGYRMDVAVGGGIGWRHLAIQQETYEGKSAAESLAYLQDPAIDFLLVAEAQARLWIAGPVHLRADVAAMMSAGNQPEDGKDHIYPLFMGSLGLDLRYEPPPDRDHDGVPDRDDRCADSLEDLDFFDDQDGCLDPDDDKDSLLDVVDQCKDAAEDLDGFQDQDGCPDHNNDRDAYPDSMDGCPDEGENENSWKDGDGCPDTVPEDLAAALGIRRDIVFHGEELDPSSEVALAGLRALLDRYPDVVMIFRVYTDGEKGATAASALTMAQSRVLYAWFTRRGVDFHRLDFRWGGDNLPLNADKTEAEHAENRRVDVGLVDNVGADGKPIEFNPLPLEQWR